MQSFGRIVYLTWFILVLLQFLKEVESECVFNQYSYQDSGIFLQEFGEAYSVVNFHGNPVRIPDQGHLEVFCSSGFRFPGHPEIFGRSESEPGKTFEEYTNISLVCQNGDMSYHFPGGLKQDILNNNLLCKDNKARFYKATVVNCRDAGFIYGFMVKDVPIVVAEFCYNVDDEKIQFVHFVGGKRPLSLEKQVEHNPSLISSPLLHTQKYVFAQQIDVQKIMDKTFVIPGFSYIAEYKLEYLSPIANYSSLFGNLASNYEFPNMIPMWTTLKNYNWRLFEELLKKETERSKFDIFVGTSGRVHYPYDLRCNSSAEFVILEENIEVPVPLLVWYYVKTNSSQENSVVIVAVNSPLVEVDSSTIVCNDMCEEISWLYPLHNSRKVASLGYIYCCRPQAVANNLSGFPPLEHVPAKHEESNSSAEVMAKPKPK